MSPSATVPRTGAALPKFAAGNGFQKELRRRVDEHFRIAGVNPRGSARILVKSIIVLAAFAVTYWLLVFHADHWTTAVPLAILLGLTMAEIGVNIQHDGGHAACSDRPWVNRLAAMTLDIIGGSSYMWHWKHVSLHHTYVNVTGHDEDIDLGPLARLSPHQKRLPFHRFQRFYLWFLYGFMAIKWHLITDFRNLITGRVGGHPIPRPKGWNLAVLLGGKAVFLSLAFAVPMMFHPPLIVLMYYGIAAFVLGLTLSIIFQLAHCVEQASFTIPEGDPARIANAWAVHQVESTVDFARRSRVVAWLLGGLNFQIEHHLFPRISHLHYPAIAKIVEDTCREYGVKYASHETFRAGLASHYRWLKRMGSPETNEAANGAATAGERLGGIGVAG